MDGGSGRFVIKHLVVWLFIVLKNSNFTTSRAEKSFFYSLQKQKIFLLPKTPIQILGPKSPSREWVPEPLIRGTKLASHFYIGLRLRMSGTLCPCPFTHLRLAQSDIFLRPHFIPLNTRRFRMWST